MGNTYYTASGITQTLGITPLLRIRESVANVSEILMTVCTDKLTERLAVKYKTFIAVKLKCTYSHAGHASIYGRLAILNARLHTIQ